MHVCARPRVHACVCAHMCACVCVCVFARAPPSLPFQLLVDTWVGGFCSLAVVGNAAVDTGHRYLFRSMFLFSRGMYPVVELLACVVW